MRLKGRDDEADPVAAQGVNVLDPPAVVIDRLLAEQYPAGGGLDHRAEAFEEGALAGTGRTDQADDLTRRHLHVHVHQGVHRGVAATLRLLSPWGYECLCPSRSASDGLGRIDHESGADGDDARQDADRPHRQKPGNGVTQLEQDVFVKTGRTGGGDLADDKTDCAQGDYRPD